MITNKIATHQLAGQDAEPFLFQTTDRDLKALQALVVQASANRPRACLKIIEIGSWVGETALAMLESCQGVNATIYCVDRWLGADSNYTSTCVTEIGGADELFRRYVKNTGPYLIGDRAQQLVPIPASSPEAAEFFPDLFADLVFIDADHAHAAVVADINAWLPKVRYDGILCGHDYNEVMPAVKEAGLKRVSMTGDCVWSFTKRRPA